MYGDTIAASMKELSGSQQRRSTEKFNKKRDYAGNHQESSESVIEATYAAEKKLFDQGQVEGMSKKN